MKNLAPGILVTLSFGDSETAQRRLELLKDLPFLEIPDAPTLLFDRLIDKRAASRKGGNR
jgi:hypothetical protein